MTMLEDYTAYMERRHGLMENKMFANLCTRQGKLYHKPFCMFGNLYYVGDNYVCAHLVDTGDGLLLFDAVNTGQGGMLIQAVWEMGFNPADIKWVVLSHGHVDHIGQAQFLKDMFGCKVYLGAPDAKMFREHPERSYIQGSNMLCDTLFEPDVEIYDGDVIAFGNTKVRFVMTPGHTEGVISAFFDITDGREVKRAGYFGGFGFNTLAKEYLLEIGDKEYFMRRIYLESLAKVQNEHVDVFMGNHPVNNDLIRKYKDMISHPGTNPFVDDSAWGNYLDQKKEEMIRFMEDPKNN